MALMTILASHGISPAEYDGMHPAVAAELGKRLLKTERERDEQFIKFAAELTKAVVRSNGARVF